MGGIWMEYVKYGREWYVTPIGHMEVGCLLGRMTFFGGGALGILEEGVEP
jgi:hypothetical protein